MNIRLSRVLSLVSAALLILSTATANTLEGLVDSEFRAKLGQPMQEPASSRGTQASKPRLLDRSDFYFHKSGRKISFLRQEDTYVVLDRRRSVRSASRASRIAARLGTDADMLDRRPFGRRPTFRIKRGRNRAAVLNRIREIDPDAFVSPVLSNSAGKENIGISPSVIVRLSSSANSRRTLAALEASLNVSSLSSPRSPEMEFELEMLNPPDDAGEVFALARALAALPEVEWAEPNFVVSARHFFTPNDPQYPDQWHLNNTGQNGAVADADVDAPEAWDSADGTGMVIAVFDDGVDIGHEDLAIWVNPGESGGGKETNGIDDDGNGYVDDYQGWDFGDNDNDPSPGLGDSHGTAVAGVAGAIGNNAIGVAGSALSAQILPIRSGSMSCTSWGDAMRYAGKYGHVVNNSWGIGGCESSIDSAIADVVGGLVPGAVRGALGTPVLFASGNAASGWEKFTLSGFSAGSYDFEWRFIKDTSLSQGYDMVWVDDISWPGGLSEDFEAETPGGVPSAFTSGGSANWSVVEDGVHARGATGKSVKAGAITDNQQTSLYALGKTVGAGDLSFWVWVSSEYNFDFFEFYVDGARYLRVAPGQYGVHENAVGYPASNPNTIAVGATRDGSVGNEEQRSAYSQFGSNLDIVAPSSGGGQGITTTDRTGADGYASGNYTSSFGGTSSATPLVAGMVADILQNDPTLTAVQLRQVLKDGADQIGPYGYSLERNNFYGDGRANLLASMPVCGNGSLDFGESCDDGNADSGDCCSATCQIETAGTVCREAAGACDLAETCDGVSDFCPVDVFEPVATLCRAAVGDCDAPDVCDGASASCPVDLKLTSECRGSAGACDLAETCDGVSDFCPGDVFEPVATLCRAAVGDCDAPDVCDGASASCPVDLKLTSECRGSAGACDLAETCDGVSDFCPGDVFEPVATLCRAAVGDCDAPDVCDGASASCPVDLKLTSECRGSAGACDLAETCDGVSDFCPGDVFEPVATLCRAAVGDCDAPDVCDGASASCPVDLKLTSECRGSAGACDLAETCDGVSDFCPGDVFEPVATLCRAAVGDCDAPDVCDGASASCPVDLKLTSECRGSAGACDLAETCDGVSDFCPVDVFEPVATLCRAAVGDCDAPDVCDGASASCPVDLKLTSECRGSAGACDLAETCDGVSDFCPGDVFEPVGTSCDDGDICTESDECHAGVCEGLPSSSPPLVCEVPVGPAVPALSSEARLLVLVGLLVVAVIGMAGRKKTPTNRRA